jgi:hypothetical protein
MTLPDFASLHSDYIHLPNISRGVFRFGAQIVEAALMSDKDAWAQMMVKLMDDGER